MLRVEVTNVKQNIVLKISQENNLNVQIQTGVVNFIMNLKISFLFFNVRQKTTNYCQFLFT